MKVFGIFGHHEVPEKYFITPRTSRLPLGYFDPWWRRWWFDVHDVVKVLLLVLLLLVVVAIGH